MCAFLRIFVQTINMLNSKFSHYDPNFKADIMKDRTEYLINKTIKIEERLKFLEEEKYFIHIGIPREIDSELEVEERIGELLGRLHKILAELRFINYCYKYGMSYSLN